jgi:hypothetical protein
LRKLFDKTLYEELSQHKNIQILSVPGDKAGAKKKASHIMYDSLFIAHDKMLLPIM